MLKLSKF